MNYVPNVYIIAYDICDDKRLRLVYKTMCGEGDRLQYSVFKCTLSDIRLEKLKIRLDKIINHDEDQILFILLGSVKSTSSWRAFTLGKPLEEPDESVRVY